MMISFSVFLRTAKSGVSPKTVHSHVPVGKSPAQMSPNTHGMICQQQGALKRGFRRVHSPGHWSRRGCHAARAPPADNQYVGLGGRVVTPHDLSLRLLGEYSLIPRSALSQKKFCFFGDLVPELKERFVGVLSRSRQIDAIAGFHSPG
jgi:hypothetical protein